MMNREEARRKAEELVGKMTLEERASQLRYDAPPIKRLGIPADHIYVTYQEIADWGWNGGNL